MLIDFHCHMLPGIDDGSRNLEQSVAMARIAAEDGIAVTVLTPHHLNGVYVNTADEVREAVRDLREHLRNRGLELKLLPGSELHLVPELPAALKDGSALTVADKGKQALVELPVHTVPVGSRRILSEIMDLGIQPVIAHPERNTRLRQNPEILGEWVNMGCLGQVTAQSCTGRFGEEIRQASREMIGRGLIHIMASDAHRDRRRIPELSAGRAQVCEWFGPAVARVLTENVPGMIIQGRPVNTELVYQALPVRAGERGGWWF